MGSSARTRRWLPARAMATSTRCRIAAAEMVGIIPKPAQGVGNSHVAEKLSGKVQGFFAFQTLVNAGSFGDLQAYRHCGIEGLPQPLGHVGQYPTPQGSQGVVRKTIQVTALHPDLSPRPLHPRAKALVWPAAAGSCRWRWPPRGAAFSPDQRVRSRSCTTGVQPALKIRKPDGKSPYLQKRRRTAGTIPASPPRTVPGTPVFQVPRPPGWPKRPLQALRPAVGRQGERPPPTWKCTAGAADTTTTGR